MEKGAIAGVGGFIMLAIALIVGAILLQGSAQNTDSVMNTVTLNSSETLAVAGSSIYIEEYKAVSGASVVNASNQSQAVPTTNYTITNNVINPTTGALSIQVTTNDGTWNSSAVYVQGTAQPLAYADSAGRSLTSLIIILMALAMAAVAIGYAVKSYND